MLGNQVQRVEHMSHGQSMEIQDLRWCVVVADGDPRFTIGADDMHMGWWVIVRMDCDAQTTVAKYSAHFNLTVGFL